MQRVGRIAIAAVCNGVSAEAVDRTLTLISGARAEIKAPALRKSSIASFLG